MSHQTSITMPRIFGIEKKNRQQHRVYIESELYMTMKAHTLDINDTVNLALEKHLRDKSLSIVTKL